VILLKMEDLKEMLTEVKKTQSFLMLKVDQLMKASESHYVEELPEDVNFPVDSLQGLDSLEERIGDSQFKINLVNISLQNLYIEAISQSRIVIMIMQPCPPCRCSIFRNILLEQTSSSSSFDVEFI